MKTEVACRANWGSWAEISVDQATGPQTPFGSSVAVAHGP